MYVQIRLKPMIEMVEPPRDAQEEDLKRRAARRTIPPWISKAIAAQAPDVVALNEYVDARDQARCRADHESFLDDLSADSDEADRLTHASGADAGRRAAETIGLYRQVGAPAAVHDEGPRPQAATPQIELFA